jgi:3-oxoadipate enol-lactonase
MDAIRSSCKADDGVEIMFETRGRRDAAERVVLIHSLAMDRHYWGPVAARLARRGVCVAALDCRGHGQSGKPPGPYAIATFANDIRALLDALRWPQAIIAGSSMGGSVALAFAIAHRERASGLALIDTTAWYGADAPKNWAERADAALTKGLDSLVAFQCTRWFGDSFRRDHADIVEACVATFLANDLAAYAATCRMLGSFDLRAGLAHLTMPVAIVVGEEDYATPPAMAEAMQAAISQATLRLLPKARHLTPLERPDEVSEEIHAIIARAQAGAHAPLRGEN